MDRELTEAEKKEVARLENAYLCSTMADGQAYFDEAPYRKQILERLKAIRGY